MSDIPILYSALILLSALVLLWTVLKGSNAKKAFHLPWYCIFIGGDIGNRKPVYLKKGIVTGKPDALFFDLSRCRFVVGEFKSRHYNGEVSEYERVQTTLYLGIAPRGALPSVGVIAYGNDVGVIIKYDRSLFKAVYRMRNQCLNSLNRW